MTFKIYNGVEPPKRRYNHRKSKYLDVYRAAMRLTVDDPTSIKVVVEPHDMNYSLGGVKSYFYSLNLKNDAPWRFKVITVHEEHSIYIQRVSVNGANQALLDE